MTSAEEPETKQTNNETKSTKPEKASWLALESNPVGANNFARRMGLPDNLAFCDIYGLDTELLAFVPQPVYAVMLLFPSSVAIKAVKSKQAEELTSDPQTLDKDLFYLYQHDGIGNACGTVAMIHAFASLTHQKSMKPLALNDGPLKNFMKETIKMDWVERGWHLAKCKDIQEVSENIASDSQTNQTATPDRAAKVNAHFISFICVSDEIYEMDGRKIFPINHGSTSSKTFLTDVAKIVKDKFMSVDPTNLNYNLMALTAVQ